MPQLVELLSHETLITILLRSESGLTLMSVWNSCKTPLVVCSLQAFNLHIQGKKENMLDRSPNQFFFSVMEMKICTLGLLTYLTCILSPYIPELFLPLHKYLPPDPDSLWLSQTLAQLWNPKPFVYAMWKFLLSIRAPGVCNQNCL